MLDQIPQSAGVWTVVAMVLGIVATLLTRALLKRDTNEQKRRDQIDALAKDSEALRGDNRQRVLDWLRRANGLSDD